MNSKHFLLLLLLLPFVSIGAPQKTPSIENILSIIRTRKVKSVDALLDQLQLNFPQIYQDPMMVRHSRSPEREDTSPRFPRVLLAAPQGSLFLGYTIDPTKPDYNKIVMIEPQRSHNAKGPHFTEIVFPSKQEAPRINSQPTSCIACHARPGRPIFDTYNLWPDMYGSSDNALIASEDSDLKDLAQDVSRHGRLKHLRFAQNKTIKTVTANAIADSAINFSAKIGHAIMGTLGEELKKIPPQKVSRSAIIKALLGCLTPPTARYQENLSHVQGQVLKYYQARRLRYKQSGGEPNNENQWPDKLGGEYALWARLTANLITITAGSGLDWSSLPSTLERNTYSFMDGGDTYQDLVCDLAKDPHYLSASERSVFSELIKTCNTEDSRLDALDPIRQKICGEANALNEDYTPIKEDILKSIELSKGDHSANSTPAPSAAPLTHLHTTASPVTPLKASQISGIALRLFQQKCISCHGNREAKNYIPFMDQKEFVKSLNRIALRKPANKPSLRLRDEILYRIQPSTPLEERMPVDMFGNAGLSSAEIRIIEGYLKSLDQTTEDTQAPLHR